ncbi:hypothetical protein B0H63DRAFT_60622 [Podospora didyma]|uniref:Uncharacterized protein n=1 Tax=Podospora didyma TaxID=330526 RepID=A0AAE0P7R3_9PEZI|nr:hypothetical protein B0H63DRAFT_60622 [Podospora didyma]
MSTRRDEEGDVVLNLERSPLLSATTLLQHRHQHQHQHEHRHSYPNTQRVTPRLEHFLSIPSMGAQGSLDSPCKQNARGDAKTVSWKDLPRKDQLVVITLARLSEPLVQTSLQVLPGP